MYDSTVSAMYFWLIATVNSCILSVNASYYITSLMHQLSILTVDSEVYYSALSVDL